MKWVKCVVDTPVIPKGTKGRVLAKEESKHTCIKWFFFEDEGIVRTVPNEYYIESEAPEWQR